MQTAELLLLLPIVVAALVTLARRLRTPYPALLLIGGLALGVIPGLPRLEIAPQSILLLVLPPILYFAAFFTPIRSFRADLGNIVSLAIGLVLASAAAAAGVALALVPGMTVPIAIALGAIVSPPDAVAATAVTSTTRGHAPSWREPPQSRDRADGLPRGARPWRSRSPPPRRSRRSGGSS